MTNRDCALLAFKMVGLWFMAGAAIGVSSIPSLWEPGDVRTMSIAFTLMSSFNKFKRNIMMQASNKTERLLRNA